MPLRKLLIYGGCHVLILRDLLDALVSDDVVATTLINFELIRGGQPFPYDRLRDYDCVFYSPIENKGDYNTSHLAAACRALGVDAFCFPWLEWHGYSPDVAKGDFKSRFQWRYVGLLEAAPTFGSFERFAEWAIEAYPDNATIDTTFTASIARLRAAEEQHATAVRVSDFILEHHTRSRLFLIPDHPSLSLYVHVLRQILYLVGIDGAARCDRLPERQEEPQWRWRTPIFPRVAKRLDLRFADARWVDDEIVPGGDLDLRSYLLLYYHSDSVILGPTDVASIAPLAAGDGCRVDPATRLLAARLAQGGDGDRADYRLIDVLCGGEMPVDRGDCFRIDERHWRTAWG